MRLTEQEYDRILSNPVGSGLFIYRSGENEISQLMATRGEMSYIEPKTEKKPKPIKQSDTTAAMKAAVVGIMGFILLMIGLGAH